jgi:geranylgeranyl diphosphate synthase type I
MDQDATRRGSDAIHVYYKNKINKLLGNNNGFHYGQSMAICMANIAFYHAMGLLSELGSDINKLYAQEIIKVSVGQMGDINSTYDSFSDQDILEYYRLKTSRYSFCLPLMMGAAIAGKPIEIYEKLGDNLGTLYQLRDDSLGLFGNPDKTGKPVGSDIESGKKTFIINKIFSKISLEEKCLFQSASPKNRLELAKQFYEKYKIEEEISSLMNALKLKAIEQIEKTDIQDILKELLEFILTRDS